MKKERILSHLSSLPPRQLGLGLLARLHCGLLAGIVCAVFFDGLTLAGVQLMSAQAAFWRGLLFALPAELCRIAANRLKHMWQFLPAALGLCALSWVLMGHPGGAVFTGLMCVLRVRARMLEEEEGHPADSLFDRPLLPALLLFAGAFLLSAGAGLPVLQRLSLTGGVLYLLVCLGYRGLWRIDEYLGLNKDMSGLPGKRIQRIAGAAVLAGVMLTAALLLPAALCADGGLRIKLPERTGGVAAPPEISAGSDPTAGQPMNMDLSGMLGGETWHIPEFVSYIFFALTGGVLVAGLAAAVRSFIKNFSLSHRDSPEGRDLIQRLGRDDLVEGGLSARFRRPSFLDRSPNAVVRRRYRKTILKANPELAKSHSPAELEAAAGLNVPRLHMAYEKARYSKEGCTGEDVAALR